MSVYIGDKCVDFINTTTNVVKPYDSKIEYLEGDGEAYIDTGVKPSAETCVEVVAQMSRVSESTTQYPAICGTYGLIDGSETQRYVIQMQNDITYYGTIGNVFQKSHGPTTSYTGNSGPRQQNMVTYKTRLILSPMGSTTGYTTVTSYLNRESLNATNSSSFDNSLYIFDIHTASGTRASTNNGKYIKIFSFNLIEKDTVMRLIPVRVGQVGYLYDEVSGQLFGNASSSGAFVLGPDIN